MSRAARKSANRTATGIREAGSQIAAAMLEAADPHTGQHSDDVELVVEEICKRLSVKGEDREDVLVAARLHDVGKVAIPNEVLQKEGPLDDAEWKLVKKHTLTGERILQSVPELGPAAELVRHSHEHFDGTGYPDGLKGEDIPLGSRIILCADAFHAIRSDRPYRKGRATRAALKEMHRCSGSQFDPKVVEALDASIKSAKRSQRRRRTLPPRLAILFAMLAIGTGGAFAAERGWIPSPIPGLGPEASNEADGNASASQAATFTEEGGLSATGNLTGSDDDDVAGTEDASGDAQGEGTAAGGDATPRQGGDGGRAGSNEAGGPGAGGSAGAQGGSFGDGGGNGGRRNDGSTGTADGAGSGAGGGGSAGAAGSAAGGGSTRRRLGRRRKLRRRQQRQRARAERFDPGPERRQPQHRRRSPWPERNARRARAAPPPVRAAPRQARAAPRPARAAAPQDRRGPRPA